jgi:hypothetical protein
MFFPPSPGTRRRHRSRRKGLAKGKCDFQPRRLWNLRGVFDNERNHMIPLGTKVRDKITGLTGVVIARTE